MTDTLQLDVEIKTISLNGKKITKSFFNQIEERKCFQNNMDFFGDDLFGYVIDKNSRYLLWSLDGKLRKTRLTPYYNLVKGSDEEPVVEDIEWFLDSFGFAYAEYDGRGSGFEERVNNTKRYYELLNKLRIFLNGISEKQIYL